MENPAQSSDLTARGWTGDETVSQTWLDVAWRALRREIPSLEGNVEAGAIHPADAIDVIAAAALRVLRNPEGIKSQSGAIDDYQESFTRADASADVYFTAAELRRLTPPEAGLGGFAGSIRYC